MTTAFDLTMEVARPAVGQDTVRFRWSSKPALPEPPDGGLFYCFPDLDITGLSEQFWMEIFLALRLGSIARLGERVLLRLPVPVPPAVIDYWRTYHAAHGVEVVPVDASDSYDPWRSRPAFSDERPFETAVFFGGGRESLTTACLLGEIYGRDRILLIQCVDPHRDGEQRRQRVQQRFDSLSLGPAASELGFSTQRVITNLHAIAIGEGGKANEPHLQQYTAGLLPVLLLRRVKRSTPGYGWIEYMISRSDQEPVFRYPRSRPECLQAESRHRQRVSAIDHQYLNVAMTISDQLGFKLLARRFTDAYRFMLTCTNGGPTVRWCQECRRCFRNAWHCLSEGVPTNQLDASRVIAHGRWSQRLVREVSLLEPPPPGANSPYTRNISGPLAFGQICETIRLPDPVWLHRSLTADAWFDALMTQAHFGNRAFPAYSASPAQAYQWLPAEIAAGVRSIIGEYAPITSELPHPMLRGDDQVESPFSVAFSHPLLDLPHVGDA